ncbi:hypothetical protein K6L44_00370, partial [Gluconacetobacter entanii]|uniref:hypothetical protein n=1 Tax=Gluconacetobacter entanii TaxID=108528 RepID=UPI001C936380
PRLRPRGACRGSRFRPRGNGGRSVAATPRWTGVFATQVRVDVFRPIFGGCGGDRDWRDC